VVIFKSGEIVIEHEVDAEGKQDVDGVSPITTAIPDGGFTGKLPTPVDTATTTRLPVEDVNAAPPVDTSIPVTPVDGLPPTEKDKEIFASHTFRNLIIFLIVACVGGVFFAWCGGMHVVRALMFKFGVKGGKKYKYAKLDDDLEK